ncbi:hypothetical protein BDY19DRAFT_190321 [Irpex rosettiformis]|uniref:Uncharacterized protein n=1 Tax=Irpex rosettiformis TaxID=378272 RepID=A0ACB8U237_9APHY|nr:hypothetical protein BDY19DRAFT_190321 [Irpex rosettiformis]
MHIKPTNNKLVKPGIYEIQSGVTSLFLNSVDGSVYNGWCDDALTLGKYPNRRGKWEIAGVGGGFTIKQVSSGLFCALADGEQFVYQPVVLSSVPTIWTIEYIDEASETVRIMWSISDICWETVRSNEEPLAYRKVTMGKPVNGFEILKETFVWNLCPVGEPDVPEPNVPEPNATRQIKPGLYALQNKVSKTFVMMGPDEKTLGCWPENAFKDKNTKIWEVTALGDGYAIRLHGTNKYCTLEESIRGDSPINVSNFQAAWRIERNHSPVHGDDDYFQLFWSNTNLTWDLSWFGKADPGTLIKLQYQNRYQECRLFKFIS